MEKTDLISKIIELAQSNQEIDVIWLYGSRAKGLAHKDSDYDLAIAFNTHPKDVFERRLRPETLAIDWSAALNTSSEKISIIDINLVPISLAWEVIKDGQAISVKNPMRQIQEELRVSSMYELDLLFHRRNYAA
ncbi:MAG: type VII toxin-antitoxin system MntA family adenylyltransferase antitoxin [Gammaproteobacteria bacterium]